VEQYSQLRLTYLTDRLSAISGVASRFPSLLSDEIDRPQTTDCLAGMWREKLIRDLQWSRKTPLGQVYAKYLAPSWSWTSVSGAVTFDPGFATAIGNLRFRNRTVCKVLEAHTTPESQLAPFWSVKSGKLVLLGPVKNLPAAYYENEQRSAVNDSVAKGSQRIQYFDGEDLPISDDEDGANKNFHVRSGYRSLSNRSPSLSLTPGTPQNLAEESTICSSGSENEVTHTTRYTYTTVEPEFYEFDVNWDHRGSRDINCVFMLLKLTWGLVLSPVRKPGTCGIYERVGYFTCAPIQLPGFGHETRFPSFDWKFKVLTVI
jgi:hypothetical protein